MAGSTRLLLVAFAAALLGTAFFFVSGGETLAGAATERRLDDVAREDSNEDLVHLVALDRANGTAREVVKPVNESEREPDESALKPLTTPASVHGTVTLPQGFPTGAGVEITGWNRDLETSIAPPTVIASENGSWSLESLAPGSWIFTARVEHGDRVATGRSDPLELAAGHDRKGVRIVMFEYVIMGTVTDSAGAPLRGLRVSYNWSGSDTALGEDDEPAGPWRVAVSSLKVDGHNVSLGRPSGIDTWIDTGANDEDLATALEAEISEELLRSLIEVRMQRIGSLGAENPLESFASPSLSLLMQNSNFQPTTDLSFSLTSRTSGEVTTDDAGRFRIPLEGPGQVSITAPAHTDQVGTLESQFLRESQSAEVTEQAPSTTVGFSLLRAATVTGQVMCSDGTKSGINIFLRPEGKSTSAGTTDDNGAFEFDRLRPGKHNFYARSGGDSGQQFSVAFVLDLREGENRYIQDVLTASSSVQGVLQDEDGQPLAGVQLTAFGKDNNDLKRYGTTDEQGLFRIAGMYAGSYILSAGDFTLGDEVEVYAPPGGAIKDIGVLTATRTLTLGSR